MEEKELSKLFISSQGLCIENVIDGEVILYNITGFDTPSIFFGETFIGIRLVGSN